MLEVSVPSTLGWEFLEEHFASFSCIPGNMGLESHRLYSINNSEIVRNDKVGRHEFSVCCSAAD